MTTHPPEKPALAQHDAYAALRIANYRRFAFGSVVALLGQQMQTITVGWEIYERTRSAAQLGFVGLALFLPFLLLILPVGHWADRYPRKTLVMVANAIEFCGALGLAWVSWSHSPIWMIYALLVVLGVAHAIRRPATSAWLPQLIPPDVYPNAAVWHSSMFQIATISGPALGGALLAFTHTATSVYGVVAACSALALGLFGLIAQQPASKDPISAKGLSIDSLWEGWDFVRNNKPILAALTLDMFAVLFGGVTMLLPIYARDLLHVGPAGLGWLRAAPSLGALVMALILAHQRPFQNAGKALVWSVIGFGAATVIFGYSKNLWLSLAMLAVTGAFDNVSMVIRNSLVQLRTPDEMRGRVAAVNSLFIGTSNELGGFESGMMAEIMGTVGATVFGGFASIATVLLIISIWPELRKMRTLGPEGGSDPA